ncbi:dihydrofolate reductase family protein [Methyloterricola oryzae]|uniref:dihydrofolate reductase family protein n=1 Tax=Methyloterricola oryzae TaxID=1495050 RepID=UPI001301334E|nr:dihydrofolate reductase family protein [Methyloterricola oryzae]
MLTHSGEPLTWENSSKLSGDTGTAVSDLKKTEGRDLLTQGSSSLYPQLCQAGLINRLT